MRSARFLLIVVAITALCAWQAVDVTAQRGPAGPGGPPGGPGIMAPMPPPPMMKAGGNGVFVLLGGTLTKLDPVTLNQEGSLQLIEKPADRGGSTQNNWPPLPPPHGTLLIAPGSHEMVLVVIGDRFFRIDAAQFTVVANSTLPKPEPPKSQNAPDQNRQPAPPPQTVELHGSILYVVSGPQIVAVNITDGSVVGETTLPKPEDPNVSR